MIMKTWIVPLLIFAMLFGSPIAFSAAPTDFTPAEKRKIQETINAKEYLDPTGRGGNILEADNQRIYLLGDVGRDGKQDIAVQFTLEVGNAEYHYLLVLERDTLNTRGLIRIGGRGYRKITITNIEKGLIYADVCWYGDEDPLPQPSVPGEVAFDIDFNGVIERYAIVRSSGKGKCQP